ncbi:MAG: hypothetical protein QXX41_05820 [Nitrososphaerota archaeon]
MNERDEINQILRELQELKKTIRRLEERMNKIEEERTSPLIRNIIEKIKEKKVITLNELKKEFPTLYGGNLSTLYQVLRNMNGFRIIQSQSRWATPVIAYFGEEENNPKTPELIAFDYFQRIPPAAIEYKPNATRYRKTIVGKEGSLKEIKEKYNLTEEQAQQVWDILTNLFKTRIIINKMDKKFIRKY